MPYITSIERMGIEKGLAEGRVEGRVEGCVEGRVEGLAEGREKAARIVLRFALAKFGSLDPIIEERIRSLTLEQIELLADALLSMDSLDQLTTWLDAQPGE